MSTNRVYRYGVPKHIHAGEYRTVHEKQSGKPKRVRKLVKVEVPAVVDQQLYLGHRCREALVDIEQEFEQACENAWRAASPLLAAAFDDLQVVDVLIGDAIKEARHERALRHSVMVTTSTADAVKEARRKVKEARATIKALKAKTTVAQAARPLLNEATASRKAAHKALYNQFCTRGVFPRLCNQCMSPEPTVDQETGICSGCLTAWPSQKLYWATFNKILDQHNVSVQRLIALRKQGRRAQLRHHRFDGTGRICVQLAREHGPNCRCYKCVSREVGAWKIVEQPDGTIEVSRRETVKPKRPAVPVTPVASIMEACTMLSEAADCPASAINLAEARGFVSKETGKYITPWNVVVDARALVGVGEPKDPARTPFLIAGADHKWRNVLQVKPWMEPDEFEAKHKNPVLGEVTFHVNEDGCVTLPLVLSRMIPAEAEITDAQLVVSREADRMQMHLCVTLELPDPPMVTDGSRLALHVGWRQMEGWVRVMTFASDQPITLPEDLRNWQVAPGIQRPIVILHESGRTGEVCLPNEWLDLAGRPPSIQSIRAQAFNTVREKFAAWLDEYGELRPFGRYRTPLSGTQLRAWQSVDRFATFATDFCTLQPFDELSGGAEMVALLHAWADGDGSDEFHGDRHLWRFATHEAAKLLRRRDDAWRTVSRRLVDTVRQLIVDDVDITSMTRKPGEASTSYSGLVPEIVARKIRARSRLASPGILRRAMVNVAERRGAEVIDAPVGIAGRTCPSCAYETDAGDPRWLNSALVPCDGCGKTYDQDVAVARYLLKTTEAQ